MEAVTPHRVAVVIPAAGRARRFGSGENKIWATLAGRAVLEWTLSAFDAHPVVASIVIAAGADERERIQALAERFPKVTAVVEGGETRAASVQQGLRAVSPDTEIVLVHDAARPLVTPAVIERVIEATARVGGAVPGLPLSDTVKRVGSDGLVRETIPRSATFDNETLSGLTAVQTPQGARLTTLLEAYARFDFIHAEPTDEASLLESIGAPVEVVLGDPTNIKITRPEDISLAESLLTSVKAKTLDIAPGQILTVPISKAGKENQGVGYLHDGTMVVVENGRPLVGETKDVTVTSVLTTVAGQMIFARVETVTKSPIPDTRHLSPASGEIRTGFGYDVHTFAAPEAGRKLFLGGVAIPHDRGLEGHSDADVLLHAVCDALLGAASLGDIGILFPNTDAAYKNISSLRLLEVCAARLAEAGWTVINIDATVVAEAPKLMPHRDAMQNAMANCLQIAPERLSVKATTSEKMGFVGRGEGIACWAVATIRAR